MRTATTTPEVDRVVRYLQTAANDDSWTCRPCCRSRDRQYRYPSTPEHYCSVCGEAMSLKEQEVTVLRLFLRPTGGTSLSSSSAQGDDELLTIHDAAEAIKKS